MSATFEFMRDNRVTLKFFIGHILVFLTVTIADKYLNPMHLSVCSPGNCDPILWNAIWVAAFCLVAITFAYSVGRIAKVFYSIWLIWALLYIGVACFLRVKFGRVLSGEILLFLIGTNKAEASTFFADAITAKFILGCAALFLVGCFLMRFIWRQRYPKASKLGCLWFFFAAAFFIWLNTIVLPIAQSAANVGYLYWPLLSVKQCMNIVRLDYDLGHSDLPSRISVRTSQKPIAGVIWIGESATRNKMGLYGYKPNTTPKLSLLSQDEIFIYKDVVCAVAGTVNAIRYLLSDSDLDSDKCSSVLPMILKRAGYNCPYICRNAYDNFVLGRIFSECTNRIIIQDARYDDSLIPHIESELANSCIVNSAIIVNGRGSHFPYDEAPIEVLGQYENPYDATIFFLDGLLCEVIDLLKQHEGPAFLLYVSDHGESPDSLAWRCLADIDTWEIPLFVWVNDAYKCAFPDIIASLQATIEVPLQSDQLYFGILRLCGIAEIPNYDVRKDFLSSKFVPRENRLVQYGQVSYEKEKKAR